MIHSSRRDLRNRAVSSLASISPDLRSTANKKGRMPGMNLRGAWK
jgi:hypothetical protein